MKHGGQREVGSDNRIAAIMTSGRKMGCMRMGMRADRTLSVIDAKNVRASVPSEAQLYKVMDLTPLDRRKAGPIRTPGEEREQSKEKHE